MERLEEVNSVTCFSRKVKRPPPIRSHMELSGGNELSEAVPNVHRHSVAHGTSGGSELSLPPPLDLSKVHVPRDSPPLGHTKSLSFFLQFVTDT
ncbi:12514_t:CDS:2, partial [Gigaspora rosea]